MQSRKEILQNIVMQTRGLCYQLGLNAAEVGKITPIFQNKTINEALDIAWNIVDQLEIHYTDPDFAITKARINLHALQDEAALLDIHELTNENASLQSKLIQLEQKLQTAEVQKKKLGAKLEASTINNAALTLNLRHQQQLAEKLRTEVLRLKAELHPGNPHSPYESPDFSRQTL